MQSLKTVPRFIHSPITSSSFSSQFSFYLLDRAEICPLPPGARYPSCPCPHSALNCHFPFYLKVLFPHPLPLIVSFNLVIFQNSFRMLARCSHVHASHIFNSCFSQFLNAFSLALSSLLFTSTAAMPSLPSPRITPSLRSCSIIIFFSKYNTRYSSLAFFSPYLLHCCVSQGSYNFWFSPHLQIPHVLTFFPLKLTYCQYPQSPCPGVTLSK